MGYSNKTAFVDAIRNDITTSLNEIYSLQSEINLSQLPLSED